MRKEIMGVSFDDVTLPQAIAAGEELAKGPGCAYVVTPNPEIVNMARQDPAYGAILNGAGLVLPDGIGVVHAAKILGTPLQGRVPGIDFATGLVARMAETGLRLYLLGAKPGVAEQAAENLKTDPPEPDRLRHPRRVFPGRCPRGRGCESCAGGRGVCLPGRPQAGAVDGRVRSGHRGPSAGGPGGRLDVYAGNVKRAPAVWQKLGLEWCYRLLHQPSRIGRMAKLPLFLVEAAREKRKKG